MDLRTQFLRPSPPLAPYLAYYFVVEADPPAPGAPGVAINVLPVPHLQLVFAWGDPSTERTMGGPAVPSPDYALTCYMSNTIEYACAGRVGVMMVGLQPWGLRSLLVGPLPEVVDRNILLGELFHHAREVEAGVRGATTLEQRIAHVETFLLRNLRQPARDEPIVEAVEEMMERKGQVVLDELAADAGLSPRQFRRRFRMSVGIDPRHFCQIVRFQGTFEAMDRHADPDWVSVAMEAGYYDQSHFINAFRAFTGLSPAAYLRQMPRTPTGLGFDAALDPADPATRVYQ